MIDQFGYVQLQRSDLLLKHSVVLVTFGNIVIFILDNFLQLFNFLLPQKFRLLRFVVELLQHFVLVLFVGLVVVTHFVHLVLQKPHVRLQLNSVATVLIPKNDGFIKIGLGFFTVDLCVLELSCT